MKASIVIASHNEGNHLLRTVESVREIAALLRMELVVADDASTDGSIAEVQRRYGEVKVVANRERLGPSPTKHLGAQAAAGEILVFLDGHTRPEDGAIFRLLERVEEERRGAIIAPRVLQLDTDTWLNLRTGFGLAHCMTLPGFDSGWLGSKGLTRRGAFYESPALCGCAFAIARELYEKLRGFDADMREWGLEDLDLGFKSWLMGHPVLVDPLACIGHAFRKEFPYGVSIEHVLVNKMRTARKNFTDSTYREWCQAIEGLYTASTWERAITRYGHREASLEEEREYLLSGRQHDEWWYARRFGLDWPAPIRE